MSDPARCDVCGCAGYRKLSRCAPQGWLYREVQDDETGAVWIVSVCSQACAANFWTPGPGSLRDGMRDPSTR